MTPRSVLRYETWTLQPDREPDAEPVLTRCSAPWTERPRRQARTSPNRRNGCCGTAARTRPTTPTGRSSPAPGGPGARCDLPRPPRRRTAPTHPTPVPAGRGRSRLPRPRQPRQGRAFSCVRCSWLWEFWPLPQKVSHDGGRADRSPVTCVSLNPAPASAQLSSSSRPPASQQAWASGTARARRAASQVPGQSAAERSDRGFRLVVRLTLPGSARRVVGGRRQRGGRQEQAAVTDRRRAAARVSGTPLIK